MDPLTGAATDTTTDAAPALPPVTQSLIDAHHHVWDPAARAQPWLAGPAMAALDRRFDLADLAAAAAGTGVRSTVLVQVLADAQETRDFLALAGEPDPAVDAVTVAGVVGWVDLTAPDVADSLAALRAGPGGDRLVGIRHLVQDEPDPRWLARPEVLRGLRAVAAAGLVYDLLVSPRQLPAAVAATRAVPEGRFVLDHLGKPPIAAGWSPGIAQPWLDGIDGLAAQDNVAVKLSGMVTEADRRRWTVADLRPWALAALAAFGPERAMFGSDWPVCLLAASYAGVAAAWRELTAELDGTERAEVGGRTAQRWYGLATSAATT